MEVCHSLLIKMIIVIIFVIFIIIVIIIFVTTTTTRNLVQIVSQTKVGLLSKQTQTTYCQLSCKGVLAIAKLKPLSLFIFLNIIALESI